MKDRIRCTLFLRFCIVSENNVECQTTMCTNVNFHMIEGAIWAYEENTCYFVDQRHANLGKRDPPLENMDLFIERYFESLSLPMSHPKVQSALKTNNFITPDVHQIQYNIFGRFHGEECRITFVETGTFFLF